MRMRTRNTTTLREPFARSRFEDRRSKVEDRRNKVVNIHATTQLKVVLVKPERFENASEIADHLKDKRTVVLNLESTNKDIARRLIDFPFRRGLRRGRARSRKWPPTPTSSRPTMWISRGDLIDELENNGMFYASESVHRGRGESC